MGVVRRGRKHGHQKPPWLGTPEPTFLPPVSPSPQGGPALGSVEPIWKAGRSAPPDLGTVVTYGSPPTLGPPMLLSQLWLSLHSLTTVCLPHRPASSSCGCPPTRASWSWPSACATPSTTAAPSTWTTTCSRGTWTMPRAQTPTIDRGGRRPPLLSNAHFQFHVDTLLW